MTSILPVLLLFTNVIIAIFLIALFYSLKRYEKNLTGYYDKKARKVLDSAKEESIKIIQQTQIFSDQLKIDAKKSVEENLKKDKSSFDEFYKSLTQSQIKYQESFLVDLRNQNAQILEKASEELNKQTTLRAKEIQNQLEDHLKQALEDINGFREVQKQNIKENVDQILTSAVLSNLPDYINIEDQEKLVEEAVEEAKKTSFFNS